MAFKKGKSGNPDGRPKGALSKRVQLAKLLEPRAGALVEKCISLALDGDTNALRLCIERLIPKARCEPVVVDLPDKFTEGDIKAIKTDVLRAVFGGQLPVDEGEKLLTLVEKHIKQPLSIKKIHVPDDPIEAAKVYQRLMGN